MDRRNNKEQNKNNRKPYGNDSKRRKSSRTSQENRDRRDVHDHREKHEIREAREVRETRDAREVNPAEPRELPEDVLIGRNAVTEALKAGRGINKLLLADGDKEGSISEIIALAKERGIIVQTVDRGKIEAVAGGRDVEALAATARAVRARFAAIADPDARGALAEAGVLTEKKMFGGLCFMVDGHMCCGILGRDLLQRVRAEETASLVQLPHVREMDFTGKVLKGFVYVGEEALRGSVRLQGWLDKGLEVIRDLPEKKPASARRTRRV